MGVLPYSAFILFDVLVLDMISTTKVVVLAISIGYVHGLKVISTDQQKILPEKNGFVEILNSSLKAYDTFSLCGRFLTYQFTSHDDAMSYHVVASIGSHFLVSGYIILPCDHVRPGCTKLSKRIIRTDWHYKKVVGYSNLGAADQWETFSGWEPGHWNSFCVTGSKSEAHLSVILNGETVAETNSYSGYYQDNQTNIILMNNIHWMPVPSHGAVSDFNIWGRVLSEEEILAWSFCEREVPGTVLSWDEASLHVSLLHLQEVEKNKICLEQRTGKKFFGFNIKRSFDETTQFCRSIGGTMSVAKDEITMEKIRKIFKKNCYQEMELIHSGFKVVGSLEMTLHFRN